jgi:RNase P/RNase MRP subunit POP5
MKQLKSLKPSMREKKRYLFLEGNFTKKDVEEAIMNYIGILGYSKATPIWISKDILSVNRGELEKVKASLVFLEGIKLKKISGTIKGLGKVKPIQN